MANALVAAKAHALLSLVQDENGMIDTKKLQVVTRELLESGQPAKRDIVRQLAALAESIQAQQLAKVTVATEMANATREALMKAIRQRHPQVKQFTWEINPDLLGGFTIRVGDTWYDTSVSADLQTIRKQFSL